VLAILAKNWITICCWFLTIVSAAYAIYEHGALIANGWIVGVVIWSTYALGLSILLGARLVLDRRLWKLVHAHKEYERSLEAQISAYHRLVSEAVNGFKSQTVQEPSARDG
jgi:hypothetical protein